MASCLCEGGAKLTSTKETTQRGRALRRLKPLRNRKSPRRPKTKRKKESLKRLKARKKPEALKKVSDGKDDKPARAPKKGNLLPPGKDVWKDVHTQVMKLAKEGKPGLRNAWEKASQAGSQQAKREFYYHVFLLDPAVSKKAVHKESLERLQEKETTTKGWMTAYQVGVLQGADPADPDFKDL